MELLNFQLSFRLETCIFGPQFSDPSWPFFLTARKRAATKMKKMGKEPSDENNDDNDDDLLTEINMGKAEPWYIGS